MFIVFSSHIRTLCLTIVLLGIFSSIIYLIYIAHFRETACFGKSHVPADAATTRTTTIAAVTTTNTAMMTTTMRRCRFCRSASQASRGRVPVGHWSMKKDFGGSLGAGSVSGRHNGAKWINMDQYGAKMTPKGSNKLPDWSQRHPNHFLC